MTYFQKHVNILRYLKIKQRTNKMRRMQYIFFKSNVLIKNVLISIRTQDLDASSYKKNTGTAGFPNSNKYYKKLANHRIGAVLQQQILDASRKCGYKKLGKYKERKATAAYSPGGKKTRQLTMHMMTVHLFLFFFLLVVSKKNQNFLF